VKNCQLLFKDSQQKCAECSAVCGSNTMVVFAASVPDIRKIQQEIFVIQLQAVPSTRWMFAMVLSYCGLRLMMIGLVRNMLTENKKCCTWRSSVYLCTLLNTTVWIPFNWKNNCYSMHVELWVHSSYVLFIFECMLPNAATFRDSSISWDGWRRVCTVTSSVCNKIGIQVMASSSQ
jgi:hypothetical protein